MTYIERIPADEGRSLRGFDRRLEDTAPHAFADHLGDRCFRCGTCDAIRQTEMAYCADCETITGSYVGRQLGTLERYWSDDAYRAECDAERTQQAAIVHAHFDAVRDADLIRLGYK